MPRASKIDEAVSSTKKGRTEAVKKEWSQEDLVPSGSTLLNLACSDSIHGAFALGGIVNIIGDSSAGKTFLALTAFAECALHKRFDNYRFIHDDAENRNNFDVSYLFGEELAKRLEAPAYDGAESKPSATAQEAHHYILTAIEEERPFIYVIDSWDALDTPDDQAKVAEMRDALVKGKKAAGSYGLAKPKAASAILKDLSGKLKKTKSLLIIISQTRDNIDPMSFSKKTRSGGKALKFYSNHEIWGACGKKITSKNLVIGVNSIWKMGKNSISGKYRDAEFPIFYDYGIDDVGSCVDFLLTVGHWSGGKSGAKINFGKDFDFEHCQRVKLISQIEELGLERQLRRIVGKAWKEREDAVKTNRKRKY